MAKRWHAVNFWDIRGEIMAHCMSNEMNLYDLLVLKLSLLPNQAFVVFLTHWMSQEASFAMSFLVNFWVWFVPPPEEPEGLVADTLPLLPYWTPFPTSHDWQRAPSWQRYNIIIYIYIIYIYSHILGGSFTIKYSKVRTHFCWSSPR